MQCALMAAAQRTTELVEYADAPLADGDAASGASSPLQSAESHAYLDDPRRFHPEYRVFVPAEGEMVVPFRAAAATWSRARRPRWAPP